MDRSKRLAFLAFVTWCAGAQSADKPKRYRIRPERMRHEIGHCYIASMDFGEEGDKYTGSKSMLQLFEDGKPLGPPRSLHQDIRDKGRGRYSHWTRAGLYLSASDNSDPRKNGRKYEVTSENPLSTLAGPPRFLAKSRDHVAEVRTSRHEYTIEMGGTLDMENTRTLSGSNCYIAFQPNVSLTIENVGDTPVVNPRLVINDRGNWYTFDSLLAEFTRGAKTDQEKVYFIWQHMRENLYHESPLFGDSEPHDPVKLFNVYGLNLCDDAGNTGCSLFYHSGFKKSKNRALNGHVQCEAFIDGGYQFMDIDMDCFYLDRENEKPVSGDECARDHDLARRELNYGPVVSRFVSSDAPAALFGPDDRQFDARLRGHEIAHTLRPGEKAVFRWDNIEKYCAENEQRAHLPKYFGNSKFVYRPRLPAGASKAPLVYEVRVPYAICGGTVRAKLAGSGASIGMSLDRKKWQDLWQQPGVGPCEVKLDQALDVHNKPAKYRYFVRVARGSATPSSLEIETDVMAAPVSLPRLRLGTNRVVYWDQTKGPHRVRITHEWQETDAVKPLAPPRASLCPQPNAVVKDSIVTFRWAPVKGAKSYHLQVSRRPDFRYPYRTSLDVIIPTTTWRVPYTGIFSPDTTYYWRLRSRDQWRVWSAWSKGWTFTWQGPRVPVNVRGAVEGQTITFLWQPNPRGERPVKYEVYGSDEKGFPIHKGEHNVPGRGKVPGNFLAETTSTSMVVVSPTATAANANKAYYRVVAIDANGTASGCSDYAELPHPFIYSKPAALASVGKPYRYQVRTLRSLGDYQCKRDRTAKRKRYAYKFWDIEQSTFKLADGPKWLSIDEESGLVAGAPTAADVGAVQAKVEVTNQFRGRAVQEFTVTVGR